MPLVFKPSDGGKEPLNAKTRCTLIQHPNGPDGGSAKQEDQLLG